MGASVSTAAVGLATSHTAAPTAQGCPADSKAAAQHAANKLKADCQHSEDKLKAYHHEDSCSICSSRSNSHMGADQDQPKQPAGRNFLAAVTKGLLHKPWSLLNTKRVTAGLAPTSQLQAAVEAAYEEILAGSKQRFEDLYHKGRVLGLGHYARVHAATSLQDGKIYAAKIMPKAEKKRKASQQLQKVIHEIAVMRLLSDHPCAVQLHQVLQDKTNYYIIMEQCTGGELFDYVYKLDHLPEAEAAYYTQQLASFLAFAHSKLIIHRDIKPENMLLAPLPEGQQAQGPSSRWQLKVVDYGCSTFCMPGQKLHEAVGTVCYVAPEVLWHNYDMQSDVWSAGVVLYMLLSGYLPFDGRNNEETLNMVRAGDYDMLQEEWSHVSQEGQDLVRLLLSYKPAGRPTAAQLLEHSWVQQRLQTSAADKLDSPAVSVAATAAAAADA